MKTIVIKLMQTHNVSNRIRNHAALFIITKRALQDTTSEHSKPVLLLQGTRMFSRSKRGDEEFPTLTLKTSSSARFSQSRCPSKYLSSRMHCLIFKPTTLQGTKCLRTPKLFLWVSSLWVLQVWLHDCSNFSAFPLHSAPIRVPSSLRTPQRVSYLCTPFPVQELLWQHHIWAVWLKMLSPHLHWALSSMHVSPHFHERLL